MQQHSKTRRFPTMRAIVVYLLTGIAIVSIFVVDAGIRRSVGGELSIEGLPIEGASLTGRWHPDLFWSGKAWWIEIETEKPIRLSLEDKDYAIPAGAHELFSNHDHTNTGQYGDMEFWGYPVKVVVSSID